MFYAAEADRADSETAARLSELPQQRNRPTHGAEARGAGAGAENKKGLHDFWTKLCSDHSGTVMRIKSASFLFFGPDA